MLKNALFIIAVIVILLVILLIPYIINHSVSPYFQKDNKQGTVWQDHAILGYTSIPDTCQVWKDYFGHSYVSECTDAYGGRLIPNRPRSCKQNVFFIGDSLVWADGIEDTKTFTYFLQEDLASKKFCVYNFGASGYSFLQMYLKITDDISHLFNPDDILIIGLSADSLMRDIYGVFGGAGYKPQYRLADGKLTVTGLINTNRFNRIPFIRHVMSWIYSKTSKDDAEELYTYLINDLIQFCQKHHIKLKIVILPFEREIIHNKNRMAYKIIRDHTPQEYLLDTTDILRAYREAGNNVSLSDLYRVHYNYPTQKVLSSFFKESIEKWR